MGAKADAYLNPPGWSDPAMPTNPDLQSAATIQTFTGKMFDLFNPNRDEIDLRDIAHALSMICRYGGHSRLFYTVAEHCTLMALHFEERGEYDLARVALLHDTSEAYMGDVVRPLKLRLPLYQQVEEVLLKNILIKFGMPPEIPFAVKEADLRICNDEREVLLLPRPWSPAIDDLPPLGVEVRAWSPIAARHNYMDTFWRLFG